MGKGLIGNTFSGCIRDILTGKISIDDVDKIYTGTCFDEVDADKRREYLESYFNRIVDFISKKDFSVDGEEKIKDKDKLKEEAEKIFYELYNSGKIVQTRYRVPEGKKEEATFINFFGELTDKTVEVDSNYGELMRINGKVYDNRSRLKNYPLLDTQHRWCEGVEQFIASQLTSVSLPDEEHNFAVTVSEELKLKLLFPEYESIITQVSDKLKESEKIEWCKLCDYDEEDIEDLEDDHILRTYVEKARSIENFEPFNSFEQILAEIENLTKEKGTISHTPSEVVEMAEKVGLTKGAVDEVPKEMVVAEKGKDDPSKEDNDNHDDHDDA